MTDYDSPWKEALDLYFQPFLALFFPLIYADIDWSRGYDSLDKELQQVTRDAELGRRYADKLVKVWLKDGAEYWVLIHIEVQGRYEVGLGKRVYVYNYRIFDRYDREVTSLVVLADDDPNWRPRGFYTTRWGCKAGIDFEPVKLLDYADRETELEASDNPFAKVLLAHLKTMETHGNAADRHACKVRLVRNLYEHGFDAKDVRELFRLIDWMMDLPPALEGLFWDDVTRIQQEKHMPFITTPERIGIRKGLMEGIEALLEVRFGAEGLQVMPEVRAVQDAEKLRALLQTIKTATNLDEVRRGWPK